MAYGICMFHFTLALGNLWDAMVLGQNPVDHALKGGRVGIVDILSFGELSRYQ